MNMEKQFEVAFDYYESGQYDKAIPLLEAIARDGSLPDGDWLLAGAPYQLGQIYQNGEGVQDKDKAIYWYRKAAQHGDNDAIIRLQELGAEVSSGNDEENIGSGGYEGSNTTDSTEKLDFSGSSNSIYERGLAAERAGNTAIANKYYAEAAVQGSEEAAEKVAKNIKESNKAPIKAAVYPIVFPVAGFIVLGIIGVVAFGFLGLIIGAVGGWILGKIASKKLIKE